MSSTELLERLLTILHFPIAKLSGGTITLASLVLAFVVFVGFVIGGKLLARGAVKVLMVRGIGEGAQFAAYKIFYYLTLGVGLAVAVDSVGINLNALLAASAVLMVGIGFGLQKVAENFISGLILLLEQPVRKGDFIAVGNTYGFIVDIGLRATRVMTRDEVMIIVPNGELVTTQVLNQSVPTKNLRISVKVGVGYGSDTSKVQSCVLEVAEQNQHILKVPAPEVRFDDFGNSSLDFSLVVWIPDPAEDLRVASKLRFAIDHKFRDHGIVIPYPQRDLHIKSFEAHALESLQSSGKQHVG